MRRLLQAGKGIKAKRVRVKEIRESMEIQKLLLP
jgi:hypothetical protein